VWSFAVRHACVHINSFFFFVISWVLTFVEKYKVNVWPRANIFPYSAHTWTYFLSHYKLMRSINNSTLSYCTHYYFYERDIWGSLRLNKTRLTNALCLLRSVSYLGAYNLKLKIKTLKNLRTWNPKCFCYVELRANLFLCQIKLNALKVHQKMEEYVLEGSSSGLDGGE
jgi:hypothetical protein